VWKAVKKRLIRLKNSLLISVSQLLPFSSKYIGTPKGYYALSKEYFNNQKADESVGYTSFLPSSAIKRVPPKSTFEEIHWKFLKNCSYTSPETFVISIPSGRVVGELGTVITHDDKLLLDVSMQFGVGRSVKWAKLHSIFSYIKLPHCQQLPHTAAVLATASGGNYFHWLTDALPRFEILRRALPNGIEGIDKFLVNEGVSAVVESLEMLNISRDQLIFLDSTTQIQAETLIVPSFPGDTCNSPAWVCSFLRNTFLRYKANISPISKLYISRSKAQYRRINNEGDVLECLSKLGFTPICLEDYDFSTQIALLSNAEVVVAPHGAGLTNLVWCSSTTKVLEIFSPNYLNLSFWAIANHVGLEYFYLIGDGQRPPDFADPYLIEDDIHVPIDKLARSLEMLLT
jgi:capsular polysaccharide biosynthesis protein